MRLAVFGASGLTGHEIVSQALARGHQVTAFVRDPKRLRISHSRLRVVTGDVRKPEDVTRAVTDQDAVVCSLGTFPRSPDTTLSEGTRHIIDAMVRQDVRRLVCVSSYGVGPSRSKAGFMFDRILRPLLLRHVIADKERQEAIVRASPLEWVIVQPGTLSRGTGNGRLRIQRAEGSAMKGRRLARADLASFLLDQLTSEVHVRETVAAMGM